jgi:glycosyltransferase involved in cell wall biosynthesis
MRILSLSNSPLDPTLGSGKTVVNWTNGLQKHGHTCCVLGRELLLRPPFSHWPGRRFTLALNAWRVLQRQLRVVRPHLVEFYGGEFGFATWAARKLSPRPLLVAHTNGLELLAHKALALPKRRSDFLHYKLDRAAFGHADRFVGLCELDRDYIVQHGLQSRERTAVIEAGLDGEFLASESAPDEGRDHAVAFTGSWVPRKDPETIVAVIEPLLRQDPRLSFRVFGAPGAEGAVRTAFSGEVHAQVQVAPKLTNAQLATQLARCKVFFFPSRYEGYGIAVTEAMACGCAVVTTPTGVGGMLRDHEDARICGFGDPAAMSTAICELLRDEPQRVRLARQGRQRVAGLSWPAQTRKLDELYTGWLAEHSAAEA